MKTSIVKNYFFYPFFALLIFLGGNVSGQTVVTYTFSGTSGTIDPNISFTTEKNNGTNDPLFSTELRLYYQSSGAGNGCSITLTPSNGAIITDVELYAVSTTYTTTVKYNVDGGGDNTASLATTTYTMSSLNASSSVKFRNANTASKQLRVSSVKITYTIPVSSNTITTSAITGSPFCVSSATGSSVSVPFTSSGTFSSNTYTAQLSNASGNFTSAVSIGTLVSNANSGTISATIPANTATGTGYRIRVVSNSPTVSGSDNGTNLVVNLASNSIAPTATQNIATGANGTVLTVTEGSTATSRAWKYSTTSGSGYTAFSPAQTGTTYTPNFATAGTYYVICESVFACGNIVSNEVRVNVVDAPANDLCASATSLTVGVAATSGTLIGSTESSSPLSVKKDVWYKFMPTCAGSHNVIVTGFSGDVDIYLFNQSSACPTTATTLTSSATLSSTETMTSTLAAGTTYFIRVMAFNVAAESNFTIQVTTTAGPEIAISNTGTPATASITAAAANSILYGFTVTPNACITTYSFTAISITKTGTSTTANVNNLRIYYDANGNGIVDGAEAVVSNSVSLSATMNFTISGQTGLSAARKYLLVGDVIASGVSGSTTFIGAATASNVTSSITVTGTATGNTMTFINISPEPTAHAGSFSCGTTTSSSIPLSWTTATGQDGYLIKWSDVSYASISDPTDGTAATTATNQMQVGSVTSTTVTGLSQNTTYYFKIYPYSNSGTNTNYRTSATVPTTSCVTLTGPCLSESFTATSFGSGFLVTNVSRSTTAADYNSSPAAAIFDQNAGKLTLPSISNPNSLTFYLGRSSNSTSKTLNINVSTTSQTTGFTTVVAYTHADVPSGSYNQYTVDLSAYTSSSTVWIQFEKVSSTNAPWRLDDIEISCGIVAPPCTPSALTTSFLPTTGSAGTLVTITGTGFSGATAVKFGTVNATSFTVVNATKIIAEVPAGIPASSNISVSDNVSCASTSSGTFTFITSTGTCLNTAGYTDLFISEVYDSESNNVWNVELFNPTASPISLDGIYSIKRAGDVSDPTNYTRIINLTGTVPALSVFTISSGNSSQACGSVSFDFTESGGGINESDVIALFKNNVLVDVANAPNETGYSLQRNIGTTVTAPSATYISGDWTNLLTETCSDIGIFTLPSDPFTLSTQPADINGCSITMAVATATVGVTYQWKFNDPATMSGWLNVNTTNLPGVTITGATTNSLSITGDVGTLNNYQFYCAVTLSGCTKNSNAAQFTLANRPKYRSKSSVDGNWSAASNWEMSYDGTTYVDACTYPKSSNSSEAIIQSGTRIVLDISSPAIDIDKLIVQTNATLEISTNTQLTIYDSTSGADFIVYGTLFDRSNAFNTPVLTGTTTWQLGASATFIKSNAGGISQYRDNYQGGMSTIPATANWIYRYNGDGNPTVGSVSFFYPNLTFENTANTALFDFGSGVMFFTGSTGITTVKGDLKIGTSGTGTVSVHNNNTYSSPLLILGNLEIASGSTLNNLSTTAGTGFELKGTLKVNGTFDVLSGTTERVLRLTGTGVQTISGSGTINLYKLTVNKAAGYVDLLRNLQVQNELVMTQGNIFTNTNVLELGLSITQKGTLDYTADFVVGSMRRWFNGTNSGISTGLFPMGADDSGLKNRHVQVEFSAAPGSGGHLTATFISSTMGNSGLPLLAPAATGGFAYDVTSTEDQGYWKMDNEATKLTDGAYTIACTGEGFQTITDLSKLTLLKRVVADGPNWFCPGTHLSPTGTTAKPTVSRSSVSGWSNFGFGGADVNPLPVELTRFEANCVENETVLSWETASEQQAEKFILETSSDALFWQKLEEIPAHGNSNTTQTYEARNKQRELTYYRLLQRDFNGNIHDYGIVVSDCGLGDDIRVFPNPMHDQVTFLYLPESTAGLTIEIFAADGRIVKVLSTKNNSAVLDINELNSGIYTYSIRNTQNKIKQGKLIKL